MTDGVEIVVDGTRMRVAGGTTVAAAMANAGMLALRRSVTGQSRGALCAMGTCHECRVTIDGVAHRKACMIVVANEMRIDRDANNA